MSEPADSLQWLELLSEPAALIAPPDHIVIAANSAFADSLKRDAAALSGIRLSSLVGARDTTRLAALLGTAGETPAITLRFERGGSRPADFACRLGPARGGTRLLRLAPADRQRTAANDPRRLQREVRELRQKLTWFREAIDTVGHSVVIFDRQGRLVLYNKYYRDGYRAGDRTLPADIVLEGKTYRELMELRVRYKLHKEFADEPERFIEDRVRRFEEGSDRVTYLANGKVVRAQYRRLNDGVRVYISTDITELMETEQKQLATELAYRTKSEFLANMSHELRTPLNAIIGFSQLIRDATMGPLDTRYKGYADDILTAGQHLLNLINDVLDLSKIEVGRMELREEVVDIARLVKDCCRMVRERVSASGQQLEQVIGPDTPYVMADELRLKQIVLNLLSNAVKFTPTGGGIRVSTNLGPDGSLALSVADTGVGMTQDDIKTALTPFRQVEGSSSRRHEGTGLGLPLAKTLTELHGASFDIASEIGVGTTMTVTLPPQRVLAPEAWLGQGAYA